MTDSTMALVAEATRRAGLVWLALPGVAYPRAAWHIWHDGAAYVITGGVEQPLPGLPEAERVTVTVRSKDSGGRLVSWVAAVNEVTPESQEWATVVRLLAKERLNATDGVGQAERWAAEAYVLRLAPTGEVPEAPGGLPDDYAAVRPAPSPATTAGRPPFLIGRAR